MIRGLCEAKGSRSTGGGQTSRSMRHRVLILASAEELAGCERAMCGSLKNYLASDSVIFMG